MGSQSWLEFWLTVTTCAGVWVATKAIIYNAAEKLFGISYRSYPRRGW